MANKKILEKKQTVIDEIKDKVNDSSSFVLFDYRGLTDAEIKELRCALRNADANYKVYKNTLMARAFNDLNIDLSSSLEGPSAFAYNTSLRDKVVYIPNTVHHIANLAFYNCKARRIIIQPSNSNLVQLGRDCFNLYGLNSDHYSNRPNLAEFNKTYNAPDVVRMSNTHWR